MAKTIEIRLVRHSDAAAVRGVYKPYVLETAITFEYDLPSEAEMASRIENITAEYPWLVCLVNGKIEGYAYGSRHRYKTAYQWSPEATVYLSAAVQGKGIGRALYETLFSILRLQGYYSVYAGVALPNERSEQLHRSMGFEEIGDFKKIGYKLGRWHDVKWFQLFLQPHRPDPPPPVSIRAIEKTEALEKLLQEASQRFS